MVLWIWQICPPQWQFKDHRCRHFTVTSKTRIFLSAATLPVICQTQLTEWSYSKAAALAQGVARITRQGQKGHAVTRGTLCLPADSHSGWGGPTTPFPQAQSDTHPSLGTAAPRSPRPAKPPRLGTAVSCLPWRGCQVRPRSLHSRTKQCSTEDDIRLPQQRHRAEAWPRKNPIWQAGPLEVLIG